MGQGGQQEQKGTNLHGQLFGTQDTSLRHLLAVPIFHTSIQIALSSNRILLVYIAHLISFVSYQCLKRVLLHFKKGTFAPPVPQNEMQEGRMLPSVPSPTCLPSLSSLVLIALILSNY